MADTTQNILINIDLETGQVNSQLDQLDEKIGGLGQNTNTQPFKSIRSEILAAREEAVRLAIAIEDAEAAGQNVDKLSERYNQVTQRAAQLNDAVEDVNNSISNANPDNRLQGLVSIAQGAVTAVQGVAGAFTLLGVDAETAQVAIAKLQGLIALTDALSSVDKITKGFKDLTSVINLAGLAQKANNAATAAAAIVQRAFTGSVVATGTAFKVLRTAIISTGIGALVVALGFAITALVDFANSQSKVEKASSDAADAIEKELRALEDLNTQIESRNRVEIARLKAQGYTEKQIRDIQLADSYRAYERAFQARQLAAELYNKNIQKADKETFDRLTKGLEEATTLANKLYNDYLVEGYTNRALDLADEQRVQNEKVQAQKEANNKRKEDLKELNDFTEEQRQIEKRRFQTDLENQVDEINKRFERALKLAKAYGKSTVELEKLRNLQISQATKGELRKAEDFAITQTLELVKKKVTILGEEISKEVTDATRTTGDADKIREKIFDIIRSRNAEITSLFQLGAQTRKKQAELEKQTRLDALAALTFEDDKTTKARRTQIKKIIEDDFTLQIAAINDEIANSEKSIRKGIEITLLEVDVTEAKERVKNVTELLLKLAQPFRRISEETIREFDKFSNSFGASIRRGLTSIDVEKELSVIDEFNKKVKEKRILNAADRSYFDKDEADKRIAIQEKYSIKEADLTDRFLALNSAKLKNRKLNTVKETEALYLELENVENAKNADLIALAAETQIKRERLLQDQKNSELNLEREKIDKIQKLRQPLSTFAVGQDSFTRNFLSGPQFKKQFDNLVNLTKNYYNELANQENADYARKLADAKFNNENTEEITRQHLENIKNLELSSQQDIQLINDATLQSKLDLYDSIGAGLGQLGQLFTKNKKVQAGFAIAEIAINTATGFVRGLDIAQKTAAGFGPGAAYAFPVFYAQQVAAVLAAANRAKSIISSIKEADANSAPTTAPSTPSAISASLFNLPPQAQAVRVIGAPDQVVRAYITNEDLRSAQEKQAFLNKLSSF